MTRKQVAMFFALALVILHSYEAVVEIGDGAEMNWLTLLGLGLVLALFVAETRTVEKRLRPLLAA